MVQWPQCLLGWNASHGQQPHQNSLELSLGGLDLLSVLNWGWANKVKDWGLAFKNWSLQVKDWSHQWLNLWNSWCHWQVGGGDTEAKTISNIVGGLELTVGINKAVRSRHSQVSIARLVLGLPRLGHQRMGRMGGLGPWRKPM